MNTASYFLCFVDLPPVSSPSLLPPLSGDQPLATVESYIQDATALLATITQPSLDILPKYQESITLLSQAERLIAAAHSLKSKLTQGLELSGGEMPATDAGVGGRVPHVRGELDVSTELLLEGPELVLNDPTSSLTGMALSGMLVAQVALQVCAPTLLHLNYHCCTAPGLGFRSV